MSDDVLEQLAELPAPRPPADLGREVHRRLNQRLVGLHAAELVVRAAPFAAAHLFEALRAAAQLSLTGRWPGEKPRR